MTCSVGFILKLIFILLVSVKEMIIWLLILLKESNNIYFFLKKNKKKQVECGSQFSVALSMSGSVYTWGKGDYHRLGHGTDDHVRRPRKVTALQGKKVISIATGKISLLCDLFVTLSILN